MKSQISSNTGFFFESILLRVSPFQVFQQSKNSVVTTYIVHGFNIIYYLSSPLQMSTSLLLQSTVMDISVNGHNLPAAILNIFNTLIILLLIPIMDRIVYPALTKCGRMPTHLQRMGNGNTSLSQLILMNINYI